MLRIGQGFDIHRLEEKENSPGIVLGGVNIPYHKFFVAHSDGDVLIHAIIDAILGACGLGDIGRHFPDTSTQYKGCDSRLLLKATLQKMHACDFEIINIDTTIIAEAPKLAAHIPLMQENVCADLQIALNQINIKAKTHEKLDSLGQKEGIAAQAVVLLSKMENHEKNIIK